MGEKWKIATMSGKSYLKFLPENSNNNYNSSDSVQFCNYFFSQTITIFKYLVRHAIFMRVFIKEAQMWV